MALSAAGFARCNKERSQFLPTPLEESAYTVIFITCSVDGSGNSVLQTGSTERTTVL